MLQLGAACTLSLRESAAARSDLLFHFFVRLLVFGMFFSNTVMYFIILSTAATLFKAGKTDINSAADAAQAKKFYVAIAIFTLLAIGLNFFAINPMRALVLAGLVQGFSTPPLMLLIMRMTNNRAIMGNRVNRRALNILGWITTAAIFSATIGLVVSWFV